MIYIITFIVILYGILRYDVDGNKSSNDALLKFIFFWLFCLGAFSYCIGQDSYGYMVEFEKYKGDILSLFAFDRRQPGWVILNYICRRFTTDFVSVKLIQSLVVNYSVYSFVKKTSEEKYTATLFYYLFVFPQFCFNVIREGMAVAFVLHAILAIREKQWWRAAFFVIIGYMFHYVAIVAGVLLVMVQIKKDNLSFWIMVISAFIFASVSSSKTLDTINNYLELLEGTEMRAYAGNYLQRDFGEKKSYLTLFVRLLTMIIPLTYCFYKKKTSEGWFLIICSFLYIYFYTLSAKILIFHRVSQLFWMPYFCCLSFFIIKVSKVELQQFKYVFLLILILLYMVPMREYFMDIPGRFHKKSEFYYPYVSVFNKEDARLYLF